MLTFSGTTNLYIMDNLQRKRWNSRIRDIVPSCNSMTAFFALRVFFFIQVLFKASDHGLHGNLDRLSCLLHVILFMFILAQSRLLKATIIDGLLTLSMLRITTRLFLGKLKPSIIELILNMRRCSRQTKEKPLFSLCMLIKLSQKWMKAQFIYHNLWDLTCT